MYWRHWSRTIDHWCRLYDYHTCVADWSVVAMESPTPALPIVAGYIIVTWSIVVASCCNMLGSG